MKVALPSGHTAEFRDQLMRGDVRDARKGMVFVISADGSRRTDGSFMDNITGRIITKMLVAWEPNDRPLPSSATTDELAQRILDELPDDDYAAMEKAVGPWVERLIQRDKPVAFVHAETGIRVEPSTPADVEKLAQLAGWEREEDASDPKTGSAPSAITG